MISPSQLRLAVNNHISKIEERPKEKAIKYPCLTEPRLLVADIGSCQSHGVPTACPQDVFSFSPSLVHVLSLVDFEDLSNCRLVNRRFYSAIKRNGIKMARRHANIHIETHQLTVVVVQLFTKTVKSMFHIHDNHIILVEYTSDAVSNLFKVSKYNGRLEYDTNSTEEGLRLVLETLLSRYDCCFYFFRTPSSNPSKHDIPLEWFTTIAYLSKRCRSRCGHLHIPVRADLAILPSIIGVGKSDVTMYAPCEGLGKNLAPFLEMGDLSFIEIELESASNLTEEIKQIMRGWQANYYHIPKLDIIFLGGVGDKWPKDRLSSYLRGLEPRIYFKLHEDEYDYDGTDPNVFNMHISRPSDDRILCIQHRDFFLVVYELTTRRTTKVWTGLNVYRGITIPEPKV